MRKMIWLCLVLFVGISLSACGRAGAPERPESDEPTYPRVYPKPVPQPTLKTS